MASYLADTVVRPCERCGRPVELDLWTVVDTVERPDLARRIEDTSIRVFTCSRCGEQVLSGDPLLILRPDAGGIGAMILATNDAEDADVIQRDGGPLVRWVAHELGVDPSRAAVIAVPWRHLPALMSRNVARDAETPDADLGLVMPAELAAGYRAFLGQVRGDLGLSWVTDLGDAELPDIDLIHQARFTCPTCAGHSLAEITRIITDSSGVATRLRDGSLYVHRCPHCNGRFVTSPIILVWRPRCSPKILVGFVQGMPEEGAREILTEILETLDQKLGPLARPEWHEQRLLLNMDDLAARLQAES